jgi:hypothetical protein
VLKIRVEGDDAAGPNKTLDIGRGFRQRILAALRRAGSSRIRARRHDSPESLISHRMTCCSRWQRGSSRRDADFLLLDCERVSVWENPAAYIAADRDEA